ncbi:uncharacterized protein FOMMEDRAFT_151337 [Fomitiporia mediterranea MF3/22]|uniref:uncharacterized protein n=1 Tax=Fomitiporia mediterranea (strain MF3/22) TaxID=694068 RepID=UPI00044092AA|nr:uncharacterized protein FOMMEDRAFT_151337 [Fomitiporia mediterranea MF3/22]EJD08473.1 hypothetical protein FOMMEDRAFT_151337 [Fomitiporia mediterranea MF3/22]
MKRSLPSASGFLLPEEILEHIISLALSSDCPADPHAPKASALSLLLVCRTFDRITRPLLYSSLHLRTRRQSDRLAEILTAQPALCAYIRSIRVDGPSSSRALLVAAHILSNSYDCSNRVLDVLDVRLVDERGHLSHRALTACQAKQDLEQLNSALRDVPDTRRLIIRQDGYLSCNTTVSFIHALTSGIRHWHSLETVDLRMRPPTPMPSLGQPRPDPFAKALSEAPNLRVLRAKQPTLLNSFLLDVANNPSLQRIELVNFSSDLSDLDSHPFFSRQLPFIHTERHHHRLAISPALHAPLPRYPQHAARVCMLTFGDFGVDPEILDAATTKLEMQIAGEPQTLFASQISAHPRLCSLVRAGRLQLIIDRMLMERSERRLRGDSCEETRHDTANALGRHLCICSGIDMGLPGPTCNGCPALRAGL